MLKKLLALVVTLVIVVTFIVYPLALQALDTRGPGNDGPAHLSAYDEDFDDMSDFKGDIEDLAGEDTNGDDMDDYEIRSIIASPAVLNNNLVRPEDTLLVMAGVEKRMDDAEVEAVSQFVANGGKLILADDYGFANDLAKKFGVTFYEEQFYELESYDINSNYTVAEGFIGVDRGSWVLDESSPVGYSFRQGERDRIWDDDNDGDMKTDEDPGDNDDTNDEDASSDDDFDNSVRVTDGRDNNGNGIIDEPFEGTDEDRLDDDGDWIAVGTDGHILHDVGQDGIGPWTAAGTRNEEWPGPDYGEGNGLPDRGEPNVDEETLNGLDDDGDGLVDEDLRSYRLVMYKPTGLLTTNKTHIIAHGTHNSYVDLNGDGRITIASDDTFESDENVDKTSFPGNEIRLMVEVYVDSDGKVVDPVSGKVDPEQSGGKVYKPSEMDEMGRIVFISSSSVFTNDLYNLNHMTLNGYGVPRVGTDSPESYFDRMANGGIGGQIRVDRDDNGRIREDDQNGVLDNTPDYTQDGDPIPDYDNREFLLALIYSLLPPPGKDEAPHKILFDESRHFISEDQVMLVPVVDTLATITYLTSDMYYSLAITASVVVLFLFAWAFTKEKEEWIHKFNLSAFKGHDSVPNTQKLQSTRVRRALLEKLRMQRGLSPEEFQALPQSSVVTMIKDPELRELAENPDKVFPQERLKIFIDKIGRIGA